MTPLRSQALIDIYGVLVVAVFIALMPGLATDPGVGWHLKTGEWIATNGEIPFTDPFLSTSSGKVWISNQWLADLLIYWGYRLGGWELLSALVIVLGVVGYLILLPLGLSKDTLKAVSAPAWFVGLLLVTLLGALQWFIRPVVFSFLLFIVVFLRLRRPTVARFDLIFLPLFFILWANIHSAFVLGFLLIGISCLTKSQDREYRGLLLLLCVLATIANPYGLTLHRNIFDLVSEPYFMTLNSEWASPDFHLRMFQPLLFSFALFLVGFVLGVRLSAFEFFSFLAFLALTMNGRRYIPFFAVLAAAPILLSIQLIFDHILTPLRRMRWTGAFLEPARPWKFCGILTGAGCVVLTAAFVSGKVQGLEKARPQAVIDAIEAVHSSGAIFHSPDDGGYITYRLWPKQRAWIDDRNELNGKALYEEYFQVVRLQAGWDQTVNRYNFEFVILDKNAPAFDMFRTLSGWSILFENAKTAVFRRQQNL